MDNRRTAERRHTIYHSKVYDDNTGDLIGYIVDVSAKGVRLVIEKSVESGEIYDLRVELPKNLHGHDVVYMKAEVRWCRQDVNPDYLAAGLDIISAPEETHVALASLQATLCFER